VTSRAATKLFQDLKQVGKHPLYDAVTVVSPLSLKAGSTKHCDNCMAVEFFFKLYIMQ